MHSKLGTVLGFGWQVLTLLGVYLLPSLQQIWLTYVPFYDQILHEACLVFNRILAAIAVLFDESFSP